LYYLRLYSHAQSLEHPRYIATIQMSESGQLLIQTDHPNYEALLREPILIYETVYTPDDGWAFMEALYEDWRKCRMYTIQKIPMEEKGGGEEG
jgi:hypothetical protein